MRRTLPLILGLLLIVAAGYVHGRLTDRWADSRSSAEAVAKIARLPMELGSWRGQDQPLDPEVIKQAGIAGYASRRFVDSRTGAAVTVLLVCGRPGPIAAHTPEVCYPGAGYEPVGEAKLRTIPVAEGGPPAEFLARDFARPSVPEARPTRILWAWSGGTVWETSENPRLSFARHANLYKLYVVSEQPAQPVDEPTNEFLKLLLSALRSLLA